MTRSFPIAAIALILLVGGAVLTVAQESEYDPDGHRKDEHQIPAGHT